MAYIQSNCFFSKNCCIKKITVNHALSSIFLFQKKELRAYMFENKLQNLKLGESIGYTFKCLGAGFWAFRQKDFRNAIQQVTMEVIKRVSSVFS